LFRTKLFTAPSSDYFYNAVVGVNFCGISSLMKLMDRAYWPTNWCMQNRFQKYLEPVSKQQHCRDICRQK